MHAMYVYIYMYIDFCQFKKNIHQRSITVCTRNNISTNENGLIK